MSTAANVSLFRGRLHDCAACVPGVGRLLLASVVTEPAGAA
jgi:hypothetical protein